MDLTSIRELVTRARNYALDGDYCLSLTCYEEAKAKIEKGNPIRSPSSKRVFISFL